MVAYLTSKG